jgi:tetratricopeptide (TPR) repeat protein
MQSGGSFLGVKCDVALKAFQTELSEQRAVNNMLGEAWVLYQIGDIYRDARRYQEARDDYELALPLFRTLKNVDAQRELFSELAGVCESLKKYGDALKYFDEELSLVRSSSNKFVRSDEGRILDRISDAEFALGDDAAGIDFLLKRLNWETAQKSDYGQFTTLKALGKAYEKIGKEREALESYERALVISKTLFRFSDDSLDDDIKQLKASIQRLK